MFDTRWVFMGLFVFFGCTFAMGKATYYSLRSNVDSLRWMTTQQQNRKQKEGKRRMGRGVEGRRTGTYKRQWYKKEKKGMVDDLG